LNEAGPMMVVAPQQRKNMRGSRSILGFGRRISGAMAKKGTRAMSARPITDEAHHEANKAFTFSSVQQVLTLVAVENECRQCTSLT
jgi:hypothetical protein